MAKNEDFLTKNLFGPEPPEKGDRGYLEQGFSRDKDGNVLDKDGNIYDESYNLIREAPSEGLKRARELMPNSPPGAIAAYGKILQRQIDAGKKKKSKS